MALACVGLWTDFYPFFFFLYCMLLLYSNCRQYYSPRVLTKNKSTLGIIKSTSRSFIYRWNSMPFNALHFVVIWPKQQQYFHLPNVIYIRQCTQFIKFQNDYIVLRIWRWSPKHFVGIIYHFTFLGVYLSFFFCSVRVKNVMTLLFTHTQHKSPKTNAYKIHWFTPRATFHSTAFGIPNRYDDSNNKKKKERKKKNNESVRKHEFLWIGNEENQYVAKNNKLWIPFIDFLASITFSRHLHKHTHRR